MNKIDKLLKDYKVERTDQQIEALMNVVRSMLLAELEGTNQEARLDEFRRLLAMLDDFE
jgi:hypothetical protein